MPKNKLATAMLTAALAVAPWCSALSAQPPAGQKGTPPASDATAREAAIRSGKEASAFCANCHGADGNSLYPEVPNLAGQNVSYLLDQIRKFGTGERKNEFMQRLIVLLSEDDRQNVARYYAQQPVRPSAGGDPALIEKGRQWYTKICFRCHGNDGRGSDRIARISGQQAGYLEITLKRYRSGSGERIDAQMAANTSVLGDADIKAVASYLSHQQ